MKKHTEKQPIDDLFAKKLSNMSLPPGADGFDRLQARMGQQKPGARMVVWRNPAVQRYMAAAACFLLVCSLGWRYWSSSTKTASGELQVAVNSAVPLRPEKSVEKPSGLSVGAPSSEKGINAPANQTIDEEQLAKVDKVSANDKGQVRASAQPVNEPKKESQLERVARSESVLAQTTPVERKTNPEPVESIPAGNVAPVSQSTPEQVAVVENKPVVKANAPAERVLVVTIEEPAALVAARQTAKAVIDEQARMAAEDKPEKEAKEGGLWKQVKRFKQGELFARGDKANNDDRGLLSRAYDGLKHSLDKDKSVKQ